MPLESSVIKRMAIIYRIDESILLVEIYRANFTAMALIGQSHLRV